jgi:hypothetical protein
MSSEHISNFIINSVNYTSNLKPFCTNTVLRPFPLCYYSTLRFTDSKFAAIIAASYRIPVSSPLVSITALWYHLGILEFISVPGESVFALVIWMVHPFLPPRLLGLLFHHEHLFRDFPPQSTPSFSGFSVPFSTSQPMKIEFCSFSFGIPRN